MDSTALNEAPCLEKLLGLKLTPDLKWNDYITSIAKEAAKMVGNLYRLRKFLTPSSIAYLFKSQIRPRMEYCCHIWAGASESSLSKLDQVQRRLRWLIGDELFNTLQPLPHRRNVASLSLFYRYFHGKCSDELHSLVPPIRSFPVRTRFAVSVHPFFVDIPKIRTKFHMDSFFPRTSSLWNSLPSECFPASYNLHLFKSRVNKHLSSKLSTM